MEFFTFILTALIGLFASTESAALATRGYVSEFIPPTPTEVTTSTTSVSFVGDVLLARDVEWQYVKDSTFDAFKFVRQSPLFTADYTVGNFEAAIPATHIPTPVNQVRFSVSTTTIEKANLPFTHLSLANNHSFDHGLEAYQNTRTVLADAGITSFGHPNETNDTSVSYIEHNGNTISIIGLHTFLRPLDPGQLEPYLQEMREQSDIQIAYVHDGQEYKLTPVLTQERFARYLIEQGIDVYIGHHPHVVQSIDWYQDRPIFYSLGNFVFDQYFSTPVQQGLGLVVQLHNERVSIALHPISSIDSKATPYLMDAKAKNQFLSTLALRSTSTLNAAVNKGIVSFTLASSSQNAMMGIQ